jgi:hypothetical protein
MLLTNITPEMVETVSSYVRRTLGHDLSKELKDGERPDHLRFYMGGNRDSNEGDIENLNIWALFPELHYYVTPKSSYRDSGDNFVNTEYSFIFHKGHGYLYKTNSDGTINNDNEVESYGGHGTVEILTDLLLRFSIYKDIDRMALAL